jgi:hypothetical protein
VLFQCSLFRNTKERVRGPSWRSLVAGRGSRSRTLPGPAYGTIADVALRCAARLEHRPATLALASPRLVSG